jgi:hypothetical protein
MFKFGKVSGGDNTASPFFQQLGNAENGYCIHVLYSALAPQFCGLREHKNTV